MTEGSHTTIDGTQHSITKRYAVHADRNGVFRATSHMPTRKGSKVEIHTIGDESDTEVLEVLSYSI